MFIYVFLYDRERWWVAEFSNHKIADGAYGRIVSYLRQTYHSSNIPNHVREQIIMVLEWLREMDSILFSPDEAEYETDDPCKENEIYRPPSAVSMYFTISPNHVWKVYIINNRFHCFKFDLTDERKNFVTLLLKGSEQDMTTVQEWLSVASKVI